MKQVLQFQSTSPQAQETLILRVRGQEVHLQGDWSNVFKPTGSSLVLARGFKLKRGDAVFEAGIGSGINSILAAKLGASRISGTDVAKEAVEWARKNADLNNVGGRTDFRHGNLFEPFNGERYDVAFSDMPFSPDMPSAVARELGLKANLLAGLCGGPTGGEATVDFVREAGKRLKPGGRIYFTIGELANVPHALNDLSKNFSVEEVHSSYSYLALDKPAYARFLMSKGSHLDFSQRRPRFRVSVYEAKLKKR